MCSLPKAASWSAVFAVAWLVAGCATAGPRPGSAGPATSITAVPYSSDSTGGANVHNGSIAREPGFVSVRMAPDGAGWALFNHGPYELVLRTDGKYWTSVTPQGASPRGGAAGRFGPAETAAVAFFPYESQQDALMFTTRNGGRDWIPSVLPGQFPPFSQQPFTFVDSRTGWALLSGGVVQTTDSGSSWHSVGPPSGSRQVGALPAPPQGAGVSFSSVQTGWVTGRGGNTVFLYETTDGGRSWRRRALHALSGAKQTESLPLIAWPGRALTLGVEVRTASGTFYVAFQSNDGGLAWKASRSVPCAFGAPASWISDTVGWVVGKTVDGQPLLEKTSNGGRNWETVHPRGFLPNGRLTGLDFVTDASGFAIERNPRGANLFLTADAGRTWRAIPDPTHF